VFSKLVMAGPMVFEIAEYAAYNQNTVSPPICVLFKKNKIEPNMCARVLLLFERTSIRLDAFVHPPGEQKQ
jgi:hypothetical protein